VTKTKRSAKTFSVRNVSDRDISAVLNNKRDMSIPLVLYIVLSSGEWCWKKSGLWLRSPAKF